MIRFLIRFYTILLMIDCLLGFFPQTLKHEWRRKLKKIGDYTCDPVRKFLPLTLPFDFSPMIVILFAYIFIEVFDYLW
jgi:uncharacterized protein YggT (Ycf19 family)